MTILSSLTFIRKNDNLNQYGIHIKNVAEVEPSPDAESLERSSFRSASSSPKSPWTRQMKMKTRGLVKASLAFSKLNISSPSNKSIAQVPSFTTREREREREREAERERVKETEKEEEAKNLQFTVVSKPKFISAPSEHELWEALPDLLSIAENYYLETYPDMKKTPMNILELDEYLSQNPIEVVASFDTYLIKIHESNLYWLARVGMALPLPPDWTLINECGRKLYMQKVHLRKIAVHPGYQFICNSVTRCRELFNQKPNSIERSVGKFQEFLDPSGNLIQIDLYLLKLAQLRKTEEFKEYCTQENRPYNIILDHINTSKAGMSAQQKKRRANIQNLRNISDLVVRNICEQLRIDPDNECHLLGFVVEYLNRHKDAPEYNEWEWRTPNDNTIYWINVHKKIAQPEFPFLKDIKEKMKHHLQELNLAMKDESYKRDLSRVCHLFKEKSVKEIKTSLLTSRSEVLKRSVVRKGTQLEEHRQTIKESIGLFYTGQSSSSFISSPRSTSKLSGYAGRSPRNQNQATRKGVIELEPVSVKRRKSKPAAEETATVFSNYFQKKREEKEKQEQRAKLESAQKAIEDINSILGAPVVDSKGSLVPANMKEFVENSLKMILSKDQVVDCIFYSLFEFEKKLDPNLKAKLRGKRFIEKLIEKEQERIRVMQQQEKRRQAREEWKFAKGMMKDETIELGFQDFMEKVRKQMARSKELDQISKELGIHHKSSL